MKNKSLSNSNHYCTKMATFISRVLYLVGAVLLLHSAFSAYEFNQFIKSTSSVLPLPLDIKAEALLGLVIFVIGSIIAIANPTSYTIEGNHAVKNNVPNNDSLLFKPIQMNKATIELEKIGAGPFTFIENRASYIDIRGKREEYNNWVTSNSE